MSFFDQQFPTGIALGAQGGPLELTNIIVVGSGAEARRARWADTGGEWDISTGIKNDTNLHELISFFRICRGSFRGFRFKDWLDYTSSIKNSPITNADQNIGTGDGSNTSFPLTKIYTFAGESVTRTILKPVVGTVVVAINGVAQTEGTDFLVDYSLGIIHFFAAPANGLAVTAGFEFDVPARFESDKLDVIGLMHDLSQAQAIIIRELKPVEVIGVDIDFTASSAVTLPDSRLTLVRASQGSYFNSAGALRFALNNEPRLDHDHVTPFAHKGILIEVERTNHLTENRDMADAAWSATDMTVAKTAVGLDGVVNSASTLTASAANGTVTQTPTLGSVERTYSVWVKRKTGSGTVEITDNNFTNTLDITASINSSTFTKFEIVRTQSNPTVGIRVVTDTDAVEVDFNQVEAGDFSTSPIDTAIFSARSGDQLTFNDTSWINNTQGTVWVECSLPDNIRTGVNLGIVDMFNSAIENHRVLFAKLSGTDKVQGVAGDPVTVALLNDTKVWSADVSRTLIMDYEEGDQALFTDDTLEDTDTAAISIVGMDTVRLGRLANTRGSGPVYLNGHIQRFRYIPVAGLN